ncbi:MAG: hypothetical protein ACP5N1_00645 [Candidatus Woesearchaeota archaeon]
MTNTEQSTDDILKNINKHLDNKNVTTKQKIGGKIGKITSGIGNWFYDHKKATAIAGAVGVLGLAGLTWLGVESATTREDYPQRDVLYSVQQERFFAGGDEKSSADNSAKTYTSRIYLGSLEGEITRSNKNIATVEHKFENNFTQYLLKDENNNLIASGSTNREIIIPTISIYGRYTSLQHTIEFSKANPIQGGMTILEIERDRVLPHRTKIDVMTINGKKILYNKLTETKAIPQGLLSQKWGRAMRRSTTLEKYTASQDDSEVKELITLWEEYNIKDSTDSRSERMNLLDKILRVEKEISKKTVYNSMEDGIIDWMPEGSRVYLNHTSTFGERLRLNTTGEEGVLRITNHWDLWPGNFFGLNKWRYDGSNGEVFSLFDKYNNGGYTISDNIGDLAEIKIVDFLLKYDRDIVFEYYIDKNGDGKLNHKTELVGRVLYQQKGSQKATDPKTEIDKGQNKKDVTYDYLIAFMGGYSSDSVERYNDFVKCGWIEAAMPDQINRGFGKHSYIGWVKDARGNIIVYNDRQPKNLSRIITEESPLTATEDIYKLLLETKRPYATKYGVETGLIILPSPTQNK